MPEFDNPFPSFDKTDQLIEALKPRINSLLQQELHIDMPGLRERLGGILPVTETGTLVPYARHALCSALVELETDGDIITDPLQGIFPTSAILPPEQSF